MRRTMLIPTTVALIAGFVVGTIGEAANWSYDLGFSVAMAAVAVIFAVWVMRERDGRSAT